MTRTRIPGLAILLTGALCSGAAAQNQPLPDPLAGPKVSDQAQAPTLVRRGYDGALKPLEAPPEIAALDLLALSEEDWSTIEPVLSERAGRIDRVVIEHILTLAELTSATAAGDKESERRLFGIIVNDLREVDRGVRLVDVIAPYVPQAQRSEYRRLVRERHLARFEELKREVVLERKPNPDAEAFERLIVEAIGLEIERSYDRIVTSKVVEFERFLSDLALDPETEGRVRRLGEAFAQRTALNPTPEQTRVLLAEIYDLLPTDAKGRLLKVLRGDGEG